jgi:hypothetical protein
MISQEIYAVKEVVLQPENFLVRENEVKPKL